MCGIAGYFGNFSQTELQSMQSLIAHRGPDQKDVWLDQAKGVGFAFARLAIIDLHPRGSQPMWDVTRRAVIVFNGEIYNYRELRSQLMMDGFVFASETDTEVVLNLYLRDGPDFVEKLDGMFAFSIWDLRSNSMMIARDGLGVKPLYWTRTERGFAFASELKALLTLYDIDKTMDPLAIVDYMRYSFCPSPLTPIKSIRKMRPGFALMLRDGSPDVTWQFYDLPYDQPIVNISEREAVEELRFLLSKAVRKQMVADVEVGAFLSGGLDSTGLVHFARENSCAGRPQCFTIEIEGQDRSNDGFSLDLPYAQHVSRKFELPLHIVKIPAESLFDIDKMVYHLDEPSYDPAALNAYYICGHAREVGVKILLSGAGGDDIFTGYRRHLALQMERYWTWLPQSSRAVLRRGVESLPQQYAFTRRAAKNFRYADGNDITRLLGYYHWLPSDRLLDIFSPKITSALESRGDEDTFRRSLAWASPDISRLNQMLYLDTKYFLTDHNLNYTDKMSMAHGVEVRVPYLDPAVISFAARLPDHFKQNGVTGKWILREALRPYLPPMILDRPKSGFGAPLRKWFDGPLKPLFNDMLSEQAIQRRGIFDARGVRKLIRDVETGQVDAVYSLFGIACMEAWFRRFVDKVTR